MEAREPEFSACGAEMSNGEAAESISTKGKINKMISFLFRNPVARLCIMRFDRVISATP
jgi:hypothetical protein